MSELRQRISGDKLVSDYERRSIVKRHFEGFGRLGSMPRTRSSLLL